MPIRRTNTFADPGLGASPSWHAFAIDQTGIAFTDDVGVVGDQRRPHRPVGVAHHRRRAGVGAGRLLRAGRHTGPRVQPRNAEPGRGRAGRSRHRGDDRPRNRVPAGRSRRWPAAVDAVGPVRPCRRARARGVRPRRQRRGRRGRCRDRAVPSRVRGQPVRDLAGAATAGGRRRPAGPDPAHHRPRRPPPRAARQPVAGTVRRQRGIGCAPALLVDHVGRPAVFRRARAQRA